MVHVSACLAALATRLFPSFRSNECAQRTVPYRVHNLKHAFFPIMTKLVRKRLFLSAAAAAGVSVAFGSPLGGVLFGLEELDLFSNDTLIWTAFVTSVIASGRLLF